MRELQQLRNKNDPPFRQTMINSKHKNVNIRMVTYLGQRQLSQSIITDNYVVKTCNPKFDFRV